MEATVTMNTLTKVRINQGTDSKEKAACFIICINQKEPVISHS